MNIRFLHLFILFFVGSATSISAQVEQISVGPAYSQQAYYTLSTGKVQVLDNDAWDIAFTNQGGSDAGVLINESSTSGEEAIALFLSEADEWGDEIVDEGQFVDSLKIYNSELNWSAGAFNSVKDTSSVFDFGWGLYNPSTHVIEGNRIFVIRQRDGSLLKFQIESLSSGTYTFKYANLDGSDEHIKTVSKDSDAENKLILFSIASGEEVTMPTDFDLVFQRYTTDLDAGDGTTIPYTVTGVLSAPGVEVAQAEGVDPEAVLEEDYADLYTSSLTAIGHDWKTFDFNLGWVIPDDRAYFVKNSKGEKYKIVFYDFEGSSTGTTTLEKTVLLSSSIEEKNILTSAVHIYPNPFTHQITVETENAKASKIRLYDVLGHLILTKDFAQRAILDANSLERGQYILQVIQEGETYTKHILK